MPLFKNVTTVPFKEVKVDFLNILHNGVSAARRSPIVSKNLGMRPKKREVNSLSKI